VLEKRRYRLLCLARQLLAVSLTFCHLRSPAAF